jgi:predicted transcriptional regulator
VPWKDAHAIYEDARRRYTEPITTEEALRAMSLEEESRVYEAAHLT